jgi:GH15 family glucan-1,4-alpha-glucosidase
MAYKPISNYGVIGNMVTAALVSRDGSIDWCCLPRFSSPSVFAAILDDDNGGYFRVCPTEVLESHQHYLPDTNILQTTCRTPTGTVTLTDFMPCYTQANGSFTAPLQIHRILRCEEGSVAVEALFQPRLDYGRADTTLRITKHGVTARNENGGVALSSTEEFRLDGPTAVSRFTLERGQTTEFVLRHGPGAPLRTSRYNPSGRFEKTHAYWHELAAGCTCEANWRDAIVRSYLTLHLLVYHPTGSMLAAATTSLPEEIGGERNWDYRFSWLRDASVTLDAFTFLGHKDEAVGYMRWLLAVCAQRGPAGQILYGIEPSDELDERILDHLKGYRNSRPVRIGNGAYEQLQLDVFGEVLEAAYNYTRIGGYVSQSTWKLLEDYVNAADRLWRMPDNGIWEVRGGPFHFVHSKVMCWVALDRGIRIATEMGYAGEHLERWRQTATDIREDILDKGWNEERQSFTQHYDTTALDSSLLLMPLLGFLPPDDDRMRATIEHVVADLSINGFLRRYRTDETDDGLTGSEGVFLWCSYWLVLNLIRLKRVEEAQALYERLLGYRNHVGLYSEMIDASTGESLGNLPQALSHLGVIIAGIELTHALQGTG